MGPVPTFPGSDEARSRRHLLKVPKRELAGKPTLALPCLRFFKWSVPCFFQLTCGQLRKGRELLSSARDAQDTCPAPAKAPRHTNKVLPDQALQPRAGSRVGLGGHRWLSSLAGGHRQTHPRRGFPEPSPIGLCRTRDPPVLLPSSSPPLRENSKPLSSAQKSELSLTPTGSRCALTARLHRGSSAVPLAAARRGDPQERAPRAPENIGSEGAPGVPSTSALTIEMHRGSLAHALERGRSCKSPSSTSLGNTSAG